MKYDIAIIGGGHAGAEAAWISSSFDLSVALVTHPDVPICRMPCNPSIGGVGKGQVVREIDALGGLMAQLADQSAIQYRTLNEGKGYAVQSTRIQADKIKYSDNAIKMLTAQSNISIIYSSLQALEDVDDYFSLTLADRTISAKKVIVTGGTFFSGLMHRGKEIERGGSLEAVVSDALQDVIHKAPLLARKFKTGTPARLDIKSVDFTKMIEQASDPETLNFSCLSFGASRSLVQVSCYLTETNARTLKIIRDAKNESPLFNGQISGVGPRYCPSIEDKAYRYPDKDIHHVFVEPEGDGIGTVYPNGLSTSLPAKTQEMFLRTINGFEKCKIRHFGYAVEYDVVDTTALDRTLEVKDVPGLYFAGQICGTSGYEEAAAQGLVAGINASLSLKGKEPLHISRDESYIGVLIEDLVSSQRDEPYRLFTARCENRLYIREDNSINRMASYRRSLDLSMPIDKIQEEYLNETELLSLLCDESFYNPSSVEQQRFKSCEYGPLQSTVSLTELICRANLDPVATLKQELASFHVVFSESAVRYCAISKKYAGYIRRGEQENRRVSKLNNKRVDWRELASSKNISVECRQRIASIRPLYFSELKKIDGIRPATLAYVASRFL